MKILVDKMPATPAECPFAERHDSPRFRELMVCPLRTQMPDGRRIRCVCTAPKCDLLKEVATQ